MTIAEQLEQKGLQKGLLKGCQEKTLEGWQSIAQPFMAGSCHKTFLVPEGRHFFFSALSVSSLRDWIHHQNLSPAINGWAMTFRPSGTKI